MIYDDYSITSSRFYIAMNAYQYLLEQFKNGKFSNKTFQQIATALKLATKQEKNQLRLSLEALEKNGEIYYDRLVYRLRKKHSQKLIEGRVRTNVRGYAFLTVEGEENDYFIPPKHLNGALNGDKVVAVRIFSSKSDDEVEVIKIIEHKTKALTGTLVTHGSVTFVLPDDKNYLSDIYIPSKYTFGAKTGDKVFIEITAFPKNKNPEGRVIEVLGKAHTLSACEKAILLNNGAPINFSEKVLDEARRISQEVSDNQLIGRLNLTDKLIFTIDGETARDFDDAISLEINEQGNYLLGVHIADVSEYVKRGSLLDEQAFERGTSIYLPDKVLPMLPFELSNGICSLCEGVMRLTLSVISEIDLSGEVLKTEYYKSFIKSAHRMTYTDVNKIILGDKDLREKYSDIADVIDKMNELKNLLENKRRLSGSIDLSVKETEIHVIDGEIELFEHQVNDATRLIEQFMVFANERVGEYLLKKQVPAIYRTHEEPSEEKYVALNNFLNTIGVKAIDEATSFVEYQQLLKRVKGTPIEQAVNKMVLRSMQKAQYQDKNIGHFGLGSKCYLHFTSPIRRYPDLVVHAILKALIDGEKGNLTDIYGDFVKKSAIQSTLREQIAEIIERETDDLYKVFYMKKFVGSTMNGIVSGVTKFGVFVELENSVEGLIKLEDLPKGKYEFVAEKMMLKGRKLSFTMGEKLVVGVIGASVSARRVELVFLEKIN